jgi:SMC interacting uncharacterized protein involved in chromosome segregation
MFVNSTFVATVALFKYFQNVLLKYQSQSERIEYLSDKVCNLEKTIHLLQQQIEELEENYILKENAIAVSNFELNSKLEDFIHYNYDMVVN